MLHHRMRKQDHTRTLLPRAHSAWMDRTLTRTRRRAPSMANSSTQTRQRLMPNQTCRMHTQSHRSRPHYQRQKRWSSIRRGQRTRSMHTLPQNRDTTAINRSTTQDQTRTTRITQSYPHLREVYPQGEASIPLPGGLARIAVEVLSSFVRTGHTFFGLVRLQGLI